MAGKKMAGKKQKRKYTHLKVVQDQGLKCPHCGELYNHRHCNIYPNGNQRCICGSCGLPFMRIKKDCTVSEK